MTLVESRFTWNQSPFHCVNLHPVLLKLKKERLGII